MTQIVLPKLSQTGTNEWADVEDNDKAIRDVVNGGLDNNNLSGSAAITGANIASATVADSNLASPNNSVYRVLLQSTAGVSNDATAATYIMTGDIGKYASGATLAFAANEILAPPMVYFDDADYTVAGKTQKLRIRAHVLTNATAPAITFTVGLYPVTCAGSADSFTFTLGTLVTGSGAAVASPSSSSVTTTAGTDFTIPADGGYALGVVTSGTIANNAAAVVYATLQTRHV
jgi:hypothetical protein